MAGPDVFLFCSGLLAATVVAAVAAAAVAVDAVVAVAIDYMHALNDKSC